MQSRPITTLFPIPTLPDDENRVFVSVGHQQMMTDPMKPLGLSLFQMTAGPPMHEAGGRLFVDVTRILAAPASRANYMDLLTKADPLTRDALQTILDRGDFIVALPDAEPVKVPSRSDAAPIEPDPAIVHELIANNQASIATLDSAIEQKSGAELRDFIRADIQELKRILFDPRSHQVFMAGMDATWWLNDHMLEWLGEKNAADTLTQSVSDNVTSEMGLALMAVADVIRPYPEVVAYLQRAEDDDFLNGVVILDGGTEAAEAIRTFLVKYGMRCVGEIDITRSRWFERPSTLLPIILGNVRNFAPGEAERRFAAGLEQASEKEEELIDRLQALPDGRRKADETKRMIDLVRTFTGYREYPKYGIICRYALYKQALLKEAGRLVETGVVGEIEDIYYLRYQELEEAVQSGIVDRDLIKKRREAFKMHQALVPPRVLTSDGECVSGAYRRGHLPAGALIGLPVSAGTIEGRARVILDVANANLEPGDILVTTYTDPSWTPLFVAIKGLVTEVGAQMTHGAVIAREYGLPAVVGVQQATRLIKDGQQIRVHGTEGYVEILS